MWLFDFIVRSEEKQTIHGDMAEWYDEIVQDSGRVYARMWLWGQVFSSLPAFFSNSFTCGGAMLRNYIKIALRNLRNQKAYSFINILGLGIGITCCLIILLYIMDELSYDRFHVNADRIFRIVAAASDDGQLTNANGIFGTGPLLKDDFPEVEEYVRLRKMGQGAKRYIGYEDRKFYEEWFFFADPTVFTVFSFPLIQGDPERALVEPNSIVITESMARKYFGDENPIGKTLETDPYNSGEMMYFQVTGIAEDVPRNSHIHFDFLASYENQTEDLTRLEGFWQHYTYVLLTHPEAADILQPKLLDFLERHWMENPWYTNHLQPLLSIHLHSQLRAEVEPTGDIAYVTIFSIVAVFVLIIACINFMNLSTARSAKRAKEVGLRKVVGAQRQQLIRQFLGESLVVGILGGIVAVILTMLLIPLFNTIADKSFSIVDLLHPSIIMGFVAIVLFIGLASGSYVAFVMSSFKPAETLKKTGRGRKSRRFVREGLVVFQFVLSIIMIVATLTAQRQMNLVRSRNTGYDRDAILVIPLNRDARQSYDALRSELLQHPGILNTTTSGYVPTRGSMHLGIRFEGQEDFITQVVYFINKEFIDTYGIEIIEGRNATRMISEEGDCDFLISTTTVTDAGYASPSDAIGKWAQRSQFKGMITGVVNDINLYSFHRIPYAITYFITPIQYHNYISIRLDTKQISDAMAHLDRVWKEVIPAYPLTYSFLGDNFELMHRADQQLNMVFQMFALLAILVACMGLFGMAAFAAEQRTKEVGIRKVLGASVSGIMMMLSGAFTKWVLLANLFAWPIAYFAMENWLRSFAYRINLGIDIFAMSTIIAFIVAVFTVSTQAIRAAVANPIESLRYE